MPPTVQDIKNAMKLGVDFFRQTVTDVAFPAPAGTPLADADPVKTGEKVLTHNTGGPFYGIISDSQSNVGVGAQVTSGTPGNKPYYPIKVRYPVKFIHTNNTNECKYTNTIKDEDGIYKMEMDCTFYWEKKAVARYILGVWTYYTESPKRFKFWAQRQWAVPPWRGLGFSNYQLVDDLTPGSGANLGPGGSVDVWEDTIGDETPNISPPLHEYPTKLQRSAAYFFDEMATYYRDEGLRDISRGIWKWVNRWENAGIMQYDFLDVFWDQLPPSDWPTGFEGNYAQWVNDGRMWWDPEMYAVVDSWNMVGLTVYQSHLIEQWRRVMYLQGVWRYLSKLPYILSARYALALSNRQKYGISSMTEKAYDILKKCNWDGEGIKISLRDQDQLCGQIGMPSAILKGALIGMFGTGAAALGASLIPVVGVPLATLLELIATAMYPAAVAAAFVPPLRAAIEKLYDENVAPESYHGIWFGNFFCAVVMLCWEVKRAPLAYNTEIWEWAKQVADQCADVAMKLQLPKTGIFYHWGDPNPRYAPHEAGGFLSSYDINTVENRGEFRADPEMLTLMFESVMRRVPEIPLVSDYSQQGPWAGGAGTAFETTMMTLKGLKMYKELILGDYTKG